MPTQFPGLVFHTPNTHISCMYVNVSGMEYQARKLSSHEICVLGVWNTKPGNWVVMNYATQFPGLVFHTPNTHIS
jgi:TATA-box binding protein (TBP) (component of TFIID and TFIIIB)